MLHPAARFGKSGRRLLTLPRTLRAGTYRFSIYAKDAAGNAQVLPVGSNRLIVR